jgi:hypothetical protein
MESLHQGAVAKRVMTRLWDSITPRERAIIAADVNCETELAKWFISTVASEVKAKYENPSYWMNDPLSFQYSQG